MLEIGASAPDFSLRDLNGQTQPLKQLRDKGPVLLAFFKVSCPVCQYTFPFLDRLHRNGTGMAIVGISQDDARSTRAYNSEFGISFPVLLDDSGYPVSNAFGIDSVPSLFLVEPDGAISMSVTGFSRKDLEALGRRLGAVPFLAQESVPDYRPG